MENLGKEKTLETENAQLREELQKAKSMREQESDEWQQAKMDLENTVIKFKKTIN